MSLGHTLGKSASRHVSVGGVLLLSWLADHELVLVDTISGDLEERSFRPGRGGCGDEAIAGRVLRGSLWRA